MIRKSLAVVLSMLVFGGTAFAQDEGETADGRQVKYKERTEIDFEGVDVTGELVKPQGALMLDRKRASFNPLIKLRKNWDEEMKHSVDEVK